MTRCHRPAFVCVIGALAVCAACDPSAEPVDTDAAVADTAPAATDSAADSGEDPVDTDAVDSDPPALWVPAAPAWGAAPVRGGTRLDVVVADVGIDGLFVGLYDRLLDVPCQPGRTGSGVLRCLPERAPLTEAFTDASCTDRVRRVPDGACRTDAVWRDRVDDERACAWPERAIDFPLTPAPDGPRFRRDGAGRCVADPGLPEDGWGRVAPLTDPPLDASAWVALAEVGQDGPAGVGRWWLVGEDGSHVLLGPGDAIGPRVPRSAGEAVRAVPGPVLDDDRKAWFATSTCDGVAAAEDRTPLDCPVPRTWASAGGFEVVDGVVAEAWERLSAAVCILRSTRGRFVRRAGPADPTSWPALADVTRGAGGWVVRGWEDAAGVWVGPRATAPVVRDGRAWTLTGLPGGAVGALPADAVDAEPDARFADDACTRPVVQLSGGVQASWVVDRAPGACGTVDGRDPVAAIWSLGASVSAPTWRLTPAGCSRDDSQLVGTWREATPAVVADAVPALPVRRVGP